MRGDGRSAAVAAVTVLSPFVKPDLVSEFDAVLLAEIGLALTILNPDSLGSFVEASQDVLVDALRIVKVQAVSPSSHLLRCFSEYPKTCKPIMDRAQLVLLCHEKCGAHAAQVSKAEKCIQEIHLDYDCVPALLAAIGELSRLLASTDEVSTKFKQESEASVKSLVDTRDGAILNAVRLVVSHWSADVRTFTTKCSADNVLDCLGQIANPATGFSVSGLFLDAVHDRSCGAPHSLTR